MSNPGIYNLFVYGSLRRDFRSPAYEYISRFFSFIGEGKVKGKLYDMGSYPAGIASEGDDYIVGELYRIKNEHEFSWAIGQLDDYEGVSVEPDEVQLYRRELTLVYGNGEPIPSWIYWYNGNPSGRPQIESGDMLAYVQQKK
jgi:gamma-glutamylcyclotransferase (GGCT)/AIG2-like uncharacterized protein YtfP